MKCTTLEYSSSLFGDWEAILNDNGIEFTWMQTKEHLKTNSGWHCEEKLSSVMSGVMGECGSYDRYLFFQIEVK